MNECCSFCLSVGLTVIIIYKKQITKKKTTKCSPYTTSDKGCLSPETVWQTYSESPLPAVECFSNLRPDDVSETTETKHTLHYYSNTHSSAYSNSRHAHLHPSIILGCTSHREKSQWNSHTMTATNAKVLFRISKHLCRVKNRATFVKSARAKRLAQHH